MAISLTLAVAFAAARVAGLPGSLHDGALAACAPTTLDAAEACLTSALSKQDLAKLVDKAGSGAFRGALDCVIEIEWRLGDANSPMAKVMLEKIGIDHPAMAAGSIIQDVQLRASGSAMDWNRARQAAGSIPLNAHRTTCPQSMERGDAD